jgi:uncharacterized protein (DUF1499 family)
MITWPIYLIFVVLIVGVFFVSLVRYFAGKDSPNHTLGVDESNDLASNENALNTFRYDDADAPTIKQKENADATRVMLLDVMSTINNSLLVTKQPNYIHYTVRSNLFGFIDDVEFYFPEDSDIVLYRAAARSGKGDLGVNKRRMEEIAACCE